MERPIGKYVTYREEYLREKGFDEETIISAKKFLEDSGKII